MFDLEEELREVDSHGQFFFVTPCRCPITRLLLPSSASSKEGRIVAVLRRLKMTPG